MEEWFQSNSYKHVGKQQATGILSKLVIATGVAYLVGVLVGIYNHDVKLIVILSSGIIILFVPYSLLKRGQVSSAGITLSFLVIGTLTASAMVGQGINDPAIVAFPIIYFLASVILNRSVLVICLLVTLLVILWLTFAELQGIFVPVSPKPTGWINSIIVAVVLLVAALASDLLANSLRKNLQRANLEINHRKQIEDTLRSSEERLRMAMIVSKQGWYDLNIKTGEVIASPEFTSIIGDDIIQTAMTYQTWVDSIHIDDRSEVLRLFNECLTKGGIKHMEYRMMTKKGEWKWIHSSAKVIAFDASGAPARMSGTHADITKRKLMEEEKVLLEQQLQRTQKVESLGELAGGIAHDFNNILAIIIGYCEKTKMNFHIADESIPEIEKAAERAAGLCRQMMAYAGKAPLIKTKIDMAAQVEEMVSMLKSSLPKNAVIKTEYLDKKQIIKGDVSQLQQVVMNLIINASEAIGIEQGEIKISLTKFDNIADKTHKDYNGKQIPFGEYVCLEVADDGCGMDDVTKWRLFEPFYSTKFAGRGLGMSAVLGIIQSHGGALQLFSQPNQGTILKVFLPALLHEFDELNELKTDENKSSSITPAAWQPSGTILLVEDEEQVRVITKEMLEVFGFIVLEAVDGKNALEIYQNNAEDIVLVFTDMGMPIMDGYELIEKLKIINPELPIIVSSGYGDSDVKTRIKSDKVAGIISKPYNLENLQQVLEMVTV